MRRVAKTSKMSDEDVIELGSSDDETEPAPKKIKPWPNAMVHIPNKLRGVTIKPVKCNSASVPKLLSGKPITVTKGFVAKPIVIPKASIEKPAQFKMLKDKPNISVKGSPSNIIAVPKVPNVIANPYAVISKINGKPMSNQNFSLPTNSMKILNQPIHKSLEVKRIFQQCKTNKCSSKLLANPIRVHSPRSLNNLPPSITVTRTSTLKRTGTATVHTVKKNCKKLKNNVGDVLTVELDDDEIPPSVSNPQWYMRPEEMERSEEVNNKEPEASNLIEITIVDSPIKPTQSKDPYRVGTELAITIDDSPIKKVTNKNAQSSGSDNEMVKGTKNKEPHSKKKLEYPNQDKASSNTVEIEIDPIEVISEKNISTEINYIENNFVEIQDSPTKIMDNFETSTPKKDKSTKPQFQNNDKQDGDIAEKEEPKKQIDINSGEFHPVYQSFIDLCFRLENSEDMKKIVEKKIKAYYRQVPKTYTESEEFIDMVLSKVLSMKAGPEKMYLYIKDIVDELNMQRKIAKAQIGNKAAASSTESDNFLYGEGSEYDLKRQRQIRKLEKTLKKLHRAIQKLEEQEVDFDDEEDSVYLLTESEDGSSSKKDNIDLPVEKKSKLVKRYKERMVRVHAKFCQLTNTKMPSEPRVQIDAGPGQPTGPAKRLEKWVNKKVPIGAPLPFPDFHDVIRCVKEANEEDKLGLNDADVMEKARDLFTRCGKKLQRRRQENEWRLAASRISLDIDPAQNSEDLKKELEANQQLALRKENEVFNKYADRQNQLKLEGEEIGDKEADESPGESEDDEVITETSLENTEKRKERLIRLLQEKSKKTGEEKENQPTEANEPMDTHTAAEKDVPKNTDVSNVKENEMRETNTENNEKMDDSNHNLTGSNDKIEKCNEFEKSHSISDDSNRLESDIDELHLLQKLHSESEAATSTLESSDSDSAIAISDTIDSCSDNKKQASDVISIENSSYSESESNKDGNNLRIDEIKCVPVPRKEIVDANVEIECSTAGIEKKRNNSNNDEYNESIEDILLASSDDDVETKQDSNHEAVPINLKDDILSIGETVIQGVESPSSESDDLKSDIKDDAKSLDGSSVECVVFVPTEDVSSNVKELDQLKNNIELTETDSVKQSNEANNDQENETAIMDNSSLNDNTSDKNISPVCDVIVDDNTPKDDSIVIEVIAGSTESNEGP